MGQAYRRELWRGGFSSVPTAPFKFSEEGKFDLRRLEKWWWHVLGCGSLLGGRGGGGRRSWLKMLLCCLLGVFEKCLVDGGSKLKRLVVC